MAFLDRQELTKVGFVGLTAFLIMTAVNVATFVIYSRRAVEWVDVPSASALNLQTARQEAALFAREISDPALLATLSSLDLQIGAVIIQLPHYQRDHNLEERLIGDLEKTLLITEEVNNNKIFQNSSPFMTSAVATERMILTRLLAFVKAGGVISG